MSDGVSARVSEPNDAATPLARGEALLAIGRHADAIRWLERAIAADPHALEPRCRLALAYIKLNQYGQAVRAADSAIGVAPDHEWPHRVRALALLRNRRKREALAAAREAVRLAPEVPETHVIHSETELANGHKSEALAAAERAVSLAPERALCHETLGEVLLELGDLDRAETHYRKALSLDPQSFEAMNNLGVVLQRRGRDGEAMEQFLQAARLNPSSTLAQENLASAIDRHVDPRPEVSRPVQVGLIVLAILLPPVRLVMLVWWLTSVAIRRSRIRALPPTLLMAYQLPRRSGMSWLAFLFWLGVVCTLMFGMAGAAMQLERQTIGLNGLLITAAVLLLMTVVAGVPVWRRWRARRAAT